MYFLDIICQVISSCVNNHCVNIGIFCNSCFYFLFHDVTSYTWVVNKWSLLDFETPRVLILLRTESPMLLTFSRFLELFSLSCSNGILLSQLLFNSSKLLQLCCTLSLLAEETWYFMLLLMSCFLRKLIILCFSRTCRPSCETRFLSF